MALSQAPPNKDGRPARSRCSWERAPTRVAGRGRAGPRGRQALLETLQEPRVWRTRFLPGAGRGAAPAAIGRTGGPPLAEAPHAPRPQGAERGCRLPGACCPRGSHAPPEWLCGGGRHTLPPKADGAGVAPRTCEQQLRGAGGGAAHAGPADCTSGAHWAPAGNRGPLGACGLCLGDWVRSSEAHGSVFAELCARGWAKRGARGRQGKEGVRKEAAAGRRVIYIFKNAPPAPLREDLASV